MLKKSLGNKTQQQQQQKAQEVIQVKLLQTSLEASWESLDSVAKGEEFTETEESQGLFCLL